ncbi:MAG: P-loop NTPase [Phascolarctobacterium faecium]
MSEQNRQCSDTGCDKTSCESCDHANTAINFSAPLHEMSTVKKVIGIVSGKGGVGKSIVTSLLAAAMQKAGKENCCFRCRYHRPINSKAFGLHGKANATELACCQCRQQVVLKSSLLIFS